MNIQEIELMKKLQRKYYEELRKTKREKGVVVNPHVLFLYRLCLVFTVGFALAFLMDMF